MPLSRQPFPLLGDADNASKRGFGLSLLLT